MTPDAFEKVALALPGATVTVQWGDDRVFKVGGKMFAVLAGPSVRPRSASFKCSDIAFEMLTARPGIKPAPYLARAKWVALDTLRALPDAEIKAYLAEAHRLVVAKLPRRLRP
ncbi:MAG TPA: MmcQ/YjbR family DNA-binding protein [Caulobacterales bacterium]|nr:MmcQ/YjbR family DNA-binding protein [Caulobacterales bacterium]